MSTANLTIIIPMAGIGSRFLKLGHATPKPLICVDGVAMFVRAAKSLPLKLAKKIIFVVQKKHIEEYSIDETIKSEFSGMPIQVISIDKMTRGQAETVYIALEKADVSGPILIFNADSAFDSNIEDTIRHMSQDVAGAIQYFNDTDPRWSFIKCDNSGEVTETAEKKAISNLASTGLYYFASSKEYADEFEKLQLHLGEFYIAPIYNQLISRGRKVIGIPVDRYYCFGTPEDLQAHISGKSYVGRNVITKNQDEMPYKATKG
jgi:NDP-sugar pyrophosphorylase family protein